MRIGVFIPPNNKEHTVMLMAFAEGIRACGYNPIVAMVDEYVPVDIAVVFGVGKKNVPVSYARGQIIANQHQRGKDVIVIEKGFVNRNEYYMAGWNGLNNRAIFCNSESRSDRWSDLGVELKDRKKPGDNIVVCGQVPSDASVQNIDIINWCTTIINLLRKHSDRKIIFRPHPLAIDRTPSMLGAKLSTSPLLDDLQDAWVVVTYNSNAAVEAVIEGVPAISMDEGSMAWDVTNHKLEDAHHPYFPGSNVCNQWAYNLAYTQWNKEEFENGLPWAHLTKRIRGASVNAKGWL